MSIDFSVQRQGAYEIKNSSSVYTKSKRKPTDPEIDFDYTHSRLVGNGDTPAQRLGISEEEYNSTETPAEQIGISKEDYIYFFGLTYVDGKMVYFPPADTPVDLQRAWYEKMRSMSIVEQGNLLSSIIAALKYGDYYTNGLTDPFVDNANMLARMKKLGGVGCLQLVHNVLSHHLSDMQYNNTIAISPHKQVEVDMLDSILELIKQDMDDEKQYQIDLANKDFLEHRHYD